MFIALQPFVLFCSIRQSFQNLQQRTFVFLFMVGLGLTLITAACSPNPSSNTESPAGPIQAVEVRIGYVVYLNLFKALRLQAIEPSVLTAVELGNQG